MAFLKKFGAKNTSAKDASVKAKMKDSEAAQGDDEEDEKDTKKAAAGKKGAFIKQFAKKK